jgi:hypothetical protein
MCGDLHWNTDRGHPSRLRNVKAIQKSLEHAIDVGGGTMAKRVTVLQSPIGAVVFHHAIMVVLANEEVDGGGTCCLNAFTNGEEVGGEDELGFVGTGTQEVDGFVVGKGGQDKDVGWVIRMRVFEIGELSEGVGDILLYPLLSQQISTLPRWVRGRHKTNDACMDAKVLESRAPESRENGVFFDMLPEARRKQDRDSIVVYRDEEANL